MSDLLAPWCEWDFRGEELGALELEGRTLHLSRLPEGLYLARFLDLSSARVHRFIGETRELAIQHAADYMRDFLSGRERRELVLADADTFQRGELERLNARVLEERRAARLTP